MFCSKCGKEIPDQAQFCNYCGTPVNNVQHQPAPAPRTVQQPAPKKKKGGIGKYIISAVVGLVVFSVVSFVVTALLSPKPENNDSPIIPSSGSSSVSEPIVEEPAVSLTEPCIHGAVYEYGFLTYGLTELYFPGYSYLPGEGDEPDALLSPDENTMFSCTKSLELMGISYDASDREGMIKSFGEGVTIILVDYQKYYVGDYPVIRYIARTDIYGPERYVGELIVFPTETATETIRLQMYATIEGGYDEINRVFDTLTIVPAEFAPTADTQAVGFNRITVK